MTTGTPAPCGCVRVAATPLPHSPQKLHRMAPAAASSVRRVLRTEAELQLVGADDPSPPPRPRRGSIRCSTSLFCGAVRLFHKENPLRSALTIASWRRGSSFFYGAFRLFGEEEDLRSALTIASSRPDPLLRRAFVYAGCPCCAGGLNGFAVEVWDWKLVSML